ncbi:hypothetical protein B0H15DRAFT_273538 [Mycena belliarum]|uniref:Protein kinase domain-containing protein n=1 Tax=Mycena belliarum TaxID=1033014 RepID=A0AAD6U9K6_9AGAR|nr:hypothetical protein B0H15DRAFT_273538 [Mycena belliae]
MALHISPVVWTLRRYSREMALTSSAEYLRGPSRAISSVPTSPSVTGSFTNLLSRSGSPFPEKSAGSPANSGHPTYNPYNTVESAGILIEGLLAKPLGADMCILWSGGMILEDTSDDGDSIPVAVKMAIPQDNGDKEAMNDTIETLRHEGLVYELLAKSGEQKVSPRYFGIFEDNAGSVALIVENGGTALKSFDGLSAQHREALFEKAEQMHTVGIVHNDLEPRNIVESAEGELRIIDFDSADMGHSCSGKEECEELLEFKKALGL